MNPETMAERGSRFNPEQWRSFTSGLRRWGASEVQIAGVVEHCRQNEGMQVRSAKHLATGPEGLNPSAESRRAEAGLKALLADSSINHEAARAALHETFERTEDAEAAVEAARIRKLEEPLVPPSPDRAPAVTGGADRTPATVLSDQLYRALAERVRPLADLKTPRVPSESTQAVADEPVEVADDNAEHRGRSAKWAALLTKARAEGAPGSIRLELGRLIGPDAPDHADTSWLVSAVKTSEVFTGQEAEAAALAEPLARQLEKNEADSLVVPHFKSLRADEYRLAVSETGQSATLTHRTPDQTGSGEQSREPSEPSAPAAEGPQMPDDGSDEIEWEPDVAGMRDAETETANENHRVVDRETSHSPVSVSVEPYDADSLPEDPLENTRWERELAGLLESIPPEGDRVRLTIQSEAPASLALLRHAEAESHRRVTARLEGPEPTSGPAEPLLMPRLEQPESDTERIAEYEIVRSSPRLRLLHREADDYVLALNPPAPEDRGDIYPLEITDEQHEHRIYPDLRRPADSRLAGPDFYQSDTELGEAPWRGRPDRIHQRGDQPRADTVPKDNAKHGRPRLQSDFGPGDLTDYPGHHSLVSRWISKAPGTTLAAERASALPPPRLELVPDEPEYLTLPDETAILNLNESHRPASLHS